MCKFLNYFICDRLFWKLLKFNYKILLISFFAIFLTITLPLSYAASSDQSNLHCTDGKVLVYRINSDKFACLNPPTADKWYKSGIAEPVEQIAAPHPEKMKSSASIPDVARGPAIDFSKGYLVEEIKMVFTG